MDNKTAIKIAKDINSTAKQLARLVGMDYKIDRLVAKHPNATVEMLEKLGSSGDSETQVAVAGNSNAPADLLEKLAVNIERKGIDFKYHIANNPNTPAAVIKKLAEDDRFVFVRAIVARNPNTPAESLEKLARDTGFAWIMRSKYWIKELVSANQNTPASVLKTLIKIAKDVNSTAEQLAGLIGMDDEIDRLVAKDCRATVEMLEKLSSSGYWGTQYAVAGNSNAPADLLEKLAVNIERREPNFRYPIANNPNTPAAVLKKLAEDDRLGLEDSAFIFVRAIVARNPNTPADSLEKLARDTRFAWLWRRKWWIKEFVAANQNTPASVLKTLAEDEDSWIRATVAENPNTPLSVLEKLIENGDIDGYFFNCYVIKLVKCRKTPDTIRQKALEKLAGSKDWTNRIIAAKNRNTPIKMLTKLLEDEHIYIRYTVAENPSTPVKLSHSIAMNPDTPAAVLEELSRDDDSEVRRYVSDNTSTPATALEKLAKDVCGVVRWEVALNSNTPIPTLEILANDAKARVRKAARNALSHSKIISGSK